MGKVVLEALFTSNAAQTNFDYDSALSEKRADYS